MAVTRSNAELYPPEDPDGRYTLPSERLMGSDDCRNCGTALAGPFCHYCGQPDRRFMRFFPVLMREFLEDFVDLDSRFARTLKPLLFRPGRLTRDFLDGRRFRYTPPLRLYLFSSIVLFLVAALVAWNTDNLKASVGNDDIVTFTPDSEEEAREIREALEGLSPEVREMVNMEDGTLTVDTRRDDSAAADAEADEDPEEFNIQFNGEDWDRETNPLIIPFLPDRLNDWINDEIGESPKKAEEINANPRIFIDQMLDLLPGTMFVLLPVFALILKFWYLFSKHFYVEHLILSLHNHAFLFVAMILLVLLDGLETLLVGVPALHWLPTTLGIGLGIWIPIYLVKSLKTVYAQGWPLTLVKAFAVGASYVFLLGFVTSFLALLSFLLL